MFTLRCRHDHVAVGRRTIAGCQLKHERLNVCAVDSSVDTVAPGWMSTRRPTFNARSAARDSFMKSRADSICNKLAEVDGDTCATWRTVHKLLHLKPPVYQNDAEFARLSSAFRQFFLNKINRLRHTIASLLQRCSRVPAVIFSQCGVMSAIS